MKKPWFEMGVMRIDNRETDDERFRIDGPPKAQILAKMRSFLSKYFKLNWLIRLN